MQKQLTFPKDKILEKLRENKKKHVNAYELAIQEYWKALEAKLEKLLDKARSRKGIKNDFWINLSVPHNHENEYNTNIQMLEFSSDIEIVLTEGEFKQFIMDEWEWKAEFNSTVASYGGR